MRFTAEIPTQALTGYHLPRLSLFRVRAVADLLQMSSACLLMTPTLLRLQTPLPILGCPMNWIRSCYPLSPPYHAASVRGGLFSAYFVDSLAQLGRGVSRGRGYWARPTGGSLAQLGRGVSRCRGYWARPVPIAFSNWVEATRLPSSPNRRRRT